MSASKRGPMINEPPRGTPDNPSIRQRKKLRKWAKGKLIKVEEEKELSRMGYIRCELHRWDLGCQTVYYLTRLGREVLGAGVQIRVPEEQQ